MKTLFKLCVILMSIILSSRPAGLFATTSHPTFSENESAIHLSYLPLINYSADGNRSNFRVFNPGASEATITWTAYNEDGSIAMSNVDAIPAGSGRDYWPMPNGDDIFTGSIVISSDQPIGAISTLHSHDGSSIASYSGAIGGANKVYLPYLFKNYHSHNTWYSVQNIGSSLANITVEYSDDQVLNTTIPAGASKTFRQSDESHNSAIFFGTVISDQPIVTTIVDTTGTVTGAYHGSHFSTKNLSFPLIINSYDSRYSTSIGIRNIGELDTDITIAYVPNHRAVRCTATNPVSPLSPHFFRLVRDAESDCNAESEINSGYVIENSAVQDIVGAVNQTLSTNKRALSIYTPTMIDEATDTVVMPLIMDRAEGYYTRFSVQHVGGPTTTVTCTFSDSDRIVAGVLDEWESLQDVQWNQIGEEYIGSAICQADNNETRIAAVVTRENLCSETDQFASYEAIAGSSSVITIPPSEGEPYNSVSLDRNYCLQQTPVDPTVGVIIGKVVDGLGEPQGHITIFVYQQNDSGEWLAVDSQATDEYGNYRITIDSPTNTYRLGFIRFIVRSYPPPDPYSEDIFFYGDTYAIEEATDISINSSEMTSINMVVEISRLLGKVTDSNDNPLENIQVTINGINAAGNGIYLNDLKTTQTDADGNYNFSNLPDGTYRVQAIGYDYYADAVVEDVIIEINQNAVVDMTLETGGRLEGTIDSEWAADSFEYNSSNILIYSQNDAGEWVEVQQDLYSEGKFDIRLAAGTYRVQFLAMRDEYSIVNTFYGEAYLIEDAIDIIIMPNQTTTIEQKMGQYATIKGNVVDGTGQPLPDIYIAFISGGVKYAWAHTNDEGNYQNYPNLLLPDTYDLEVYVNWGDIYSSHRAKLAKTVSNVVVDLNDMLTVDVVLDTIGSVTGQVKDISGTPIQGESVKAYAYDENGELEELGRAVSDAEGNYLLWGLLEGSYYIRLSPYRDGPYLPTYYASTLSVEEANPVSVRPNTTTTGVDIVPINASTLAGQVTDQDNNLIEGISITLTRKNEEGEWESFSRDNSAVTNAQGQYIFYNLPDGLYRIAVTGHDYYLDAIVEDLEVAINQRTITNITVETGGQLEANIIGDMWDFSFILYSLNENQVWEEVETGPFRDRLLRLRVAEGTYRLKFVVRDNSRLMDTFYGGAFIFEDAADITVVRGETTSIEAILGERATITGLVTDINGTPISNLMVTLYRQDEHGQWVEMHYIYNSTTDSSGRYTSSGLGPGLYRVGYVYTPSSYSRTPEFHTAFYENAFDLESATDIHVHRVETINADIMINRSGTISGRVTDSEGQALNYVNISTYQHNVCTGRFNPIPDWRNSDYTDNAGNYKVVVEPGTYTLGFDSEGEYLSQYYSQTNTLYEAQEFVVGLNQAFTGIDVQLQDPSIGGTISGQITNMDGEPLSLAMVELKRYDEMEKRWIWERGDWTSNSGYYTATGLITGTYRILFNGNQPYGDGINDEYASQYYGGGVAIETGTDIEVVGGQTVTDISASLPLGGRIWGEIKDEAGYEIWYSGEVRLYSYDPATETKYYLDHYSGISDYSLKGLLPGTYIVEASGPSYIPDTTIITITDHGGRYNVDPVLKKSATITGQISLTDLDFAQCIEINAYGEDGTEVEMFTTMTPDSDGTFSFNEGLSPGNYRLEFTDTSGKHKSLMSEMITIGPEGIAGGVNVALQDAVDETPTPTATPTAIPTATSTTTATVTAMPTLTQINTATPLPTATAMQPTVTATLMTPLPTETPTVIAMPPTATLPPTAMATAVPPDQDVDFVLVSYSYEVSCADGYVKIHWESEAAENVTNYRLHRRTITGYIDGMPVYGDERWITPIHIVSTPLNQYKIIDAHIEIGTDYNYRLYGFDASLSLSSAKIHNLDEVTSFSCTTTPTVEPTTTNEPLQEDTATPLPPTATATVEPTAVATAALPTETPTMDSTPAAAPTVAPTATLIPSDTPVPTEQPTQIPTVDVTVEVTPTATSIPTNMPIPTNTLVPAILTGRIEVIESEVGLGNVGSWSIDLTNDGQLAIEDVVLSADLPTDTTLDPSGEDAGWTCTEGDTTQNELAVTCSWSLDTIEPGESKNIILAVVISQDFTGTEIQAPSILVQSNTGGDMLNLLAETGNNITVTSPLAEELVEGSDELSSYQIYLPVINR